MEDLREFIIRRLKHSETRASERHINLETLTQDERDMFDKGYDVAYWRGRASALDDILGEVEEYLKIQTEKEIEQSWQDNPDRMGGQYTDRELLDYENWG